MEVVYRSIMLSISNEKLFPPLSYTKHTSYTVSTIHTTFLSGTISAGTKVELDLNLTEKSNITSHFLCGKAKDSRMSFLMSFFLLPTTAKGQSTTEH